MAIAPLWVSIRTTGAAALARTGAMLRAFAAAARAASRRVGASTSSMASRFMAHLRAMRAGAAAAGRSLATDLAAGLQRVASNPAIIAAGTAIGAVLAPAIGAALNAGILAVLGGGLAAAGAAIAVKQSEAVQAAFRNAFKPIGKEIADVATSAFEGPMIQAAGRFRQAWSSVGEDVGDAFRTAAKFVEPLAEGVSQLVENMLGGGGFNRAMEAAGPVISELSTGLSRLGGAFNSFFDSMADSGAGATKGMIIIFAALAGSIVALGNVIEFLSKAFDKGTNFAQRYAQVFEKMLGWIPGVGDAWSYVAETLTLFNDAAGKTTDIMPILGAETDNTADALARQQAAAQAAAKAAQELSTKMSGLLGDQMTAQEAAIAWEQALDDLTESFRQNGLNIDIATQKGRDNTQTVLAAVQAAEAKRQAAIALAGGEKASADAVAAANAAFSAQIDQLAATLRQAGLTEDQVNQLLQAYRNVAAMGDISKQITIRIRYLRIGDRVHNPYELGSEYSSGIGGRAAGGPIQAGQPYLVGEKGPELIMPERNGMVYTAAETARMLAGASASGGGNASGTGSNRTRAGAAWSGSMGGLDAMFFRWLQQSIRTGKLKLA